MGGTVALWRAAWAAMAWLFAWPALAQGDDGVTALAQWVRASNDAQGRPFVVVDKTNARVFVFAADGALLGSTPALLGMTRGDEPAAPGIAQRLKTGGLPAELQTTPAGRFDAVPGHNLRGEAIVWVDYRAALALHRLRPAPAAEQRPQRLASQTAADNRISLGCVIVAEAFFDGVIAPHLGRQRSVVYVLPDSKHWSEQFPAAAAVAG